MPIDRGRAARGAVAGAVAAAVWAVQQPLDQRVFGVRYDDTELLGKLVTRGRAWPVAGLAMHLANGAAFGALYATAAPRMPVPSWSRGPLAAMGEHLGSWPGVALTDRFHPARDDMPSLAGDPRAFAQATWRHLLFGVVLGEVERRLNPVEEEVVPQDFEAVASTNGHGNIEHAASPGGPHSLT